MQGQILYQRIEQIKIVKDLKNSYKIFIYNNSLNSKLIKILVLFNKFIITSFKAYYTFVHEVL